MLTTDIEFLSFLFFPFFFALLAFDAFIFDIKVTLAS
jgi:hypothetical protein